MKIFFDIETAPDGDINEIEVKAPANYKKPEAIAKYQDEHREEEYRKRALKGVSGQIVSIAWSFGAAATSEARPMGEPEATLLETFFEAIERYRRTQKPGEHIQWVGHNVIDFDLRFLKQRAWVCGVRPPLEIPADARHGSQAFDVMKEWAGWRGYVSQDALYDALGGPDRGDGTTGADVYDMWQSGDLEALRLYNERDVMKLLFNYRRLTWQK